MPVTMTVEVIGVKEINDKLKRMAEEIPEKMGMALELHALEIMNESRKECPHRTGHLRRSGYVDRWKQDANKAITVAMGYNATYAEYVHENLRARHAPPTKAKYLEDPIRRAAPKLPALIAAELWEDLDEYSE